ncbi:Nidogen-1 [Halotydeus destructor]|nr:Nidogen-1 [Halotydeus destructor]
MATARLAYLVIAVVCPLVHSVPPQLLFPYGAENGDQEMPKGDDVSSPEIRLSVPITFYENTFDSIFINDNGVVSFITEVPSFFNGQFPLNYPMIAPFYADVDIRAGGAIYFRESTDENLLARAASDVMTHWSRPVLDFRPRAILIVTWAQVGHFNQSTGSKVNTFQVIIVSDGRQSFVFFLYQDGGIGWTQGDGKTPNLADAQAQAGFMAGDGRHYVLRGSGSAQVYNYDKMSNTVQRTPGIWLFRTGLLNPGENVEAAMEKRIVPPEQETCTSAENPCPPTSECTNYAVGFCCKCGEGFTGNGISCLPANSPHRLNGRLNGLVNDVQLDNVDLHAYINTVEGRTFTALNQVPVAIGRDLQLAMTLGDVIGWMFALEEPGLPNGFTLTGGIFNRTAEIQFPQTGHKLNIVEQFLGLDVYDYPKVTVELRGSLPSIATGGGIELEDFIETFSMANRFTIRSHSKRSYRLNENSVEIPFIVDQHIYFESCPFKDEERKFESIVLEVSKNYIVYEETYGIVRYAANYRILPPSADNPCNRPEFRCPQFSTCVPDGIRAKCLCQPGFKLSYDQYGKETCIDTDECLSGLQRCHPEADCTNTVGSYSCVCREGFTGNGYFCSSTEETPRPVAPTDCRLDATICDEHADCIYDDVLKDQVCLCRDGYMGPGSYCIQDPDRCQYQCGDLAECRFNQTVNGYNCECRDGYEGDGFTCNPKEQSVRCSTRDDCDRNADCLFDQELQAYSCQCNEGFTGNGIGCSKQLFIDCSTKIDMCSHWADCINVYQRYECRCREGYHGNGTSCEPQHECLADHHCSPNAQCLTDSVDMRMKCECKEGYVKENRLCLPDPNASCHLVPNCQAQASCRYDSKLVQHKCVCNEGFKGDGKSNCERIIIPCNILNKCHHKAECLYSSHEQGFRCQCRDGYHGDGSTCRPNRPCNEDIQQCDANAECILDMTGYSCQCSVGFLGDGYQCLPAPRHNGDYLIFSREMALLRLPTHQREEDSGHLLIGLPNETPVGVDVDCLGGEIYWSDNKGGAIRKMAYNASKKETVLDKTMLGGAIESPEGLAVDWISRNIYWVDSMRTSIQVTRLENRYTKTLIKDNIENPRGLVLHPGLGKMYWSDWTRNAPRIEAANMDGTERMTLVNSDFSLPNMLAIDYTTNELCWTDRGTDGRIQCISLNGQNYRIVFAERDHIPFDLTFAGEYIFWTSWKNGPADPITPTIRRMNRFGGAPEPLTLPPGGNGKLLGIATVPAQCPRMSNPCSVNNGGCKFICLPSGRGSRTCACPDIGGEDCTEIM